MIKTKKTKTEIQSAIIDIHIEAEAHLAIFKANMSLAVLEHNALYAEMYKSVAQAEHSMYHEALKAGEELRGYVQEMK